MGTKISEDENTLSSSIEALAKAFEQAKVQYFIGGSFASSVQGEFLSTNHLDVVCDLKPSQVVAFVESLGESFIVDVVGLETATRESSSYNIIHEPSFLKIDLFFVRNDFHRAQLMRSIKVSLPSTSIEVNVASSEDIVLEAIS